MRQILEALFVYIFYFILDSCFAADGRWKDWKRKVFQLNILPEQNEQQSEVYHQLLDLAGDGQLDVVEFDSPTPGFYERTKDEAWRTFKPFVSLPNISWQDPNLKFVDLTGDGHADIFITEDDAFTWYQSLAEIGFATSEKCARRLMKRRGQNSYSQTARNPFT